MAPVSVIIIIDVLICKWYFNVVVILTTSYTPGQFNLLSKCGAVIILWYSVYVGDNPLNSPPKEH